jgi:hypothetical protein
MEFDSLLKISNSFEKFNCFQRGLMCCIVCDAEFPDELSLDRHRLLEHCKQPKGSKCAICHANLANLGVFMEHSRAHGAGGSSELSCVICRQTIRGDQQLQMHGKYHLLEWEERGEEFMAEHNESAETLAGSTAVVECSTCKQVGDSFFGFAEIFQSTVGFLFRP